MLNSQLLNNMGDFFTSFTEMVKLAQTQNLETVVSGLTQARTDLEAHASAKADLEELAQFKATKEKQLQEIAEAKQATDEAARLNTEHAKALTDATELLESQKAEHKKNVQALEDTKAAVKNREHAVALAEQTIKEANEKALQTLKDAQSVKQAYIAKLQALAKQEGAGNVSNGS